VGLYPVMISRDVAKTAPAELLPDELRPAVSLNSLSPADRIFGWVEQEGGRGRAGEKRAYKGQLRIASLRYAGCDGTAVTLFDKPGLPLAILSTPKPEQARFYVAADRLGTPQAGNINKLRAAYDGATGGAAKGLRGRKVYPHHYGLPDKYWEGPAAFEATKNRPENPQRVNGRFREYVRVATADALRDDQNRSISGWVNPGVRFRTEIDVMNLSEVELGALLYLLGLPDRCYFRLGGGKPLGFGSARISLAEVDLRDGVAVAEDLLALLPSSRKPGGRSLRSSTDTAPLIRAYKAALVEAYGQGRGFEEIPFIKAFLNAARGFADQKPVHYPRLAHANWNDGEAVPPNPEGKNYEWFVANDRAARFEPDSRPTLDALWEPTGVLMLKARDDARRPDRRAGEQRRGPDRYNPRPRR
jgi:CRISPR-associated protein (TIGR03986 family)